MIFINNKYTRWYFNIIYKSRDIKINGATERHHVFPKSIFLEYKNLCDYKWNEAHLTFREHYICHWLLIKMTTGDDYFKMLYAFNFINAMSKKKYNTKITSRAYKVIKEKLSYFNSQRMKNYWANRSAAEIKISNQKMAITLANKSESELNESTRKRRASFNNYIQNRSESEIIKFSEKTKDAWANKSKKEINHHAGLISKIRKGKKHFTNGTISKMCIPGHEPPGFIPGRTLTKKK